MESAFDQISKDLGGKLEEEAAARNRIPEEDATTFCLWLKEELKDSIAKVTFSKRLTTTPAILTGQVSSSMQVMMKMMEQSGQASKGAHRLCTLRISKAPAWCSEESNLARVSIET